MLKAALPNVCTAVACTNWCQGTKTTCDSASCKGYANSKKKKGKQ